MTRRTRNIHWDGIVGGVIGGVAMLAIVCALWYWVNIWLPQKENEAKRLHMNQMAERYWELREAKAR